MNLKSLYNLFAQHPESRWIMKPANAIALYEFVKQNDIKKVLDLGTGIGLSAALVALALKEKGVEYHIDSVEQYEKCVKIAKELIPKELQENLTIHYSPPTVISFPEIPYQHFSTFESIPEGDYDLIINDGPGGFLKDGHFIDLMNGTITKMLQEGKIKPGAFIAWDGREIMLATLERYYSDNFLFKRPAQRGDNLNIIKRKDNPVSFKDEALEYKIQQKYFDESLFTDNSSPAQSENGTPDQRASEAL